MRSKIYHLLNDSRDDDHQGARRLGLFLGLLIILNVVAMIVETVPEIEKSYHRAFAIFEIFSLMIFGTEYVLRVWSSGENPKYAGVRGRLRFMLRPMALIDLLAILPSFVMSPDQADFRILRLVRLFRLLRLLKLARYSRALRTMGLVLRIKAPDILVASSIGTVLLIFASSVMYLAEGHAQPEKFSSIPATMWWAVATLTTVGYGDVYPITPLGKLLGSVIAILGVGMVALPAGIIASGFSEKLHTDDETTDACPHCGHKLS